MSTSSEHDYPPGDWTVDGIAETLAAQPAEFSLPRYDGSEAWAAVTDEPAMQPVVETVLALAEHVKENPRPLYPISRYASYRTERDANRPGSYKGWGQQRSDVSVLALAECFEREGRFFDPLLDELWAFCDHSVWLHPANIPDEQKREGIPQPMSPEERPVALRTAEMAHLFGEIDYVFGDHLHPALRERMRDEIDRRVLRPYEVRDDLWWFEDPSTTNWNAVCNAGVAHGALYLCEDETRAARIVEKAVGSLGDYLDNFGPDGATSEGIGYWSYGFGNYVQLAATLETRTGGEYSLFTPPIVDEIARFPLRVELSEGRSPAFSDSDEKRDVDPYLGCWLGDRLDLSALTARGRSSFERHREDFFTDDYHMNHFPDVLRSLVWYLDSETPTTSGDYPRRREFMAGHQIWVARVDPDDHDGLVLAAKGGHNDESHNHNDCGSFVVHWRGESQLTDLGSPQYAEDYFTDRRYEYLAARSLGHPVPYVNGHEQAAGEEYAATVVAREESDSEDALTLELAGCYPDEAGLASLARTFSLERTGRGRVTVTDDATFEPEVDDPTFESVLVSFAQMETDDGRLRVEGDRGTLTVTPGSATADVTVERLTDAIDKSTPRDVDFGDDEHPDVWRARIEAPEGTETSTTVTIEPERDSS